MIHLPRLYGKGGKSCARDEHAGPVSEARPGGHGGRAAPFPPALTGGESHHQGAKVDWLTVTWQPEQGQDVARWAYEFLTNYLGGVLAESVNGLFGYQSGVRFFVPVAGVPIHVGRVDYGGAHHGGRARLDLSGAGCSRVTRWLHVQTELDQLAEVKLTRVDLACDFLDGRFSVEDAVDWYRAGEFNAGGRNPRHSLIGDWLEPRHGRTLEVGRRENGKMLRCYEKGRQLGNQDSPWTRFEVEIRNNDRDIPVDVLTRCDEYFVGAYKCLEQLLDAPAERIATHQAEGEIAFDRLVETASTAYGRLVNVMRGVMTIDQIMDSLSRPGFPKRLERAALGGFYQGAPTAPPPH
uniref:Replication initiation protein-like C-terminal domain-containing protein n=1 Tax=biofilter metagenome TaxID=1070537 RepID=A0A193SD77_9ZZZZ